MLDAELDLLATRVKQAEIRIVDLELERDAQAEINKISKFAHLSLKKRLSPFTPSSTRTQTDLAEKPYGPDSSK